MISTIPQPKIFDSFSKFDFFKVFDYVCNRTEVTKTLVSSELDSPKVVRSDFYNAIKTTRIVLGLS